MVEFDILGAIDRAGLEKRNTLRTWMLRNHDAFARKLQEVKPDWELLTGVFAEAKLTDARGKVVTSSETVRKTWLRVRRELLAQQEKAPVQRPPSRVRPVAETAPEKSDPMADIYRQWDEQGRKMPEPLNKGKS